MTALLAWVLLADTLGGGGNYGMVDNSSLSSEAHFAEGFEATGDYDTVCTTSARRYDFDGVQACGPVTDVAPSALNISAPSAAALATGASQTGANVVIRPGSGTHKAVVSAASFVNGVTTFTVTIDGTANTGTESTAFECDSVTNTVCANNIANWIEGLAGAAGVHACSSGSTTTCTTFGFTGVAGTVYFFPAPEDSPGKFIDSIACSTGAAATLTNGTNGIVSTNTSPLLANITRIGDSTVPSGGMALYGTSNFAIIRADSGLAVQTSAGAYSVAVNSEYLSMGSDGFLQWGSTAAVPTSAKDARISRPAAGALLIDGGAHATLGKGQGTTIALATQSLTFAANPGDATKVTSGLVPDGAFLLGITTRVTTTATNCTSVSIGDGSDVDMFGATTAITQNTTTTNADATAQFARSPATAAMEVTITANGGNCYTGVWAVTAHYINPIAATAN